MTLERQQLALTILGSGLYRVTPHGVVWSCRKKGRSLPTEKWNRLRLQTQNIGYVTTRLVFDKKEYSFLVHSLVWLQYRGEIPFKLEVNHMDGIKANNKLSNLELVTRSENLLHAFRIGLAKRIYKIPIEQHEGLRKRLLATKISQRKLAKELRVSHTTIQEIVKLGLTKEFQNAS